MVGGGASLLELKGSSGGRRSWWRVRGEVAESGKASRQRTEGQRALLSLNLVRQCSCIAQRGTLRQRTTRSRAIRVVDGAGGKRGLPTHRTQRSVRGIEVGLQVCCCPACSYMSPHSNAAQLVRSADARAGCRRGSMLDTRCSLLDAHCSMQFSPGARKPTARRKSSGRPQAIIEKNDEGVV